MGNRIGMIEYIEPQCLKNIEYKKDKKSDIYSLGVLLWEISSGRPSFPNYYPRETLAFHISYNNLREIPIEGTPLEYQQLYQECWDCEPESRPDIEEVYEILETSFDLQSLPHLNMPNNDDSKDDLILHSNNSRIISSDTTELNSILNKNGEQRLDKKVNNTLSQLKTGSFDQQSPHLNILNNDLNLENNLKVEFRKLIIVGRTNSGKSKLAEVNKRDMPNLLVIDGKITADEVEAIFGNDIHEHITIVRTKFSNFKNEDKCKKDKEDLCKQNEEIRQKIVYVDNPLININVKDKDDETTITLSRERRDWSRTILLDHLNKVYGEKYKSIYLDGTTSSKKRNEESYIPKLMKRVTSFINLNSARFKLNQLNPNKLEREKIRNLLIIGRTGSGKSVLSDVLCGTYDLTQLKRIFNKNLSNGEEQNIV
ncbi:hypothetical protein C1646_677412 [Rhizophagus diaphanus]|nr:hypothetical protein C1646_677412 [Rhizophagus diaphanus] [Rhizophagus sp. MUCL 43196]